VPHRRRRHSLINVQVNSWFHVRGRKGLQRYNYISSPSGSRIQRSLQVNKMNKYINKRVRIIRLFYSIIRTAYYFPPPFVVPQNGTTQEGLKRFSRNCILESYENMCWKCSICIKSDRNNGHFHEKLYTFLRSRRVWHAKYLSERKKNLNRITGFWTFSIVWYSREHDVSETGSLSVLGWRWGRRHLLSWAP
jgi:hypothetical protein